MVLILICLTGASLLQDQLQRSSNINMNVLQTAFASVTPKTTTTEPTITNYNVIVEKIRTTNNTLVKKGTAILYDGPDAAIGIQIGLENLSPHQQMYLYNGSYSITKPLNFTNGIYIHGQGNSTILDYSHIGVKNAILMSKNSHLADIKISGSINPLPNDLTQKIIAGTNVIIENVLISKMGYGIEANNKYNVTLTNIK
jgi:hypothetical protein